MALLLICSSSFLFTIKMPLNNIYNDIAGENSSVIKVYVVHYPSVFLETWEDKRGCTTTGMIKLCGASFFS